MKLVGRRTELAVIERLLEKVVGGSGGHLVISGPPGAGKTVLLAAAAMCAQSRSVPVFRVAGTARSEVPLWKQLLHDLGVDGLRPDADEDVLGNAARAIARGGPRLLLIDDVDRSDARTAKFLAALTSCLGDGATGVLATAHDPLGLAPQMRLRSLTETQLSELLGNLSGEAVHAIWLASGGLPGAAISVADQLVDLGEGADPLVHLALTTDSKASFLDFDISLVRLLETAIQRPVPPVTRARLLARLARELLGDPAGEAQRRMLMEEAVALARMAGDPRALAEVLESRLHALWDPAAAHERLAAASEIVEHARMAGDELTERRGLFWRFTALAELGQLAAAEGVLTAYARAGELVGDAEAVVVVRARQAMLATIRGQFETARTLTTQVAVEGRRAGLADTERLVGSLSTGLSRLSGDFGSMVTPWREMARRLPGHFFEATAARALAESGSTEEAGLELERLLPAVLAGAGPRWLGVVADLAAVAARAADPSSARSLYEVLLPYQGRLVVWGGAHTITGPVDDYLGRLAARLGALDQAVAHFDRAVELEQQSGTLPWLAQTLASRSGALSARGSGEDRSRADDDLVRARSIAGRLGMQALLDAIDLPVQEWRLGRDGEDWILEAGAERARLRDGRGVRYLRSLLAAPGHEIPALDLVAGGSGMAAPTSDPVLDDAARDAYQRRLAALGEQLDAADRCGDVERARAVEAERQALLNELRRAVGLGGRSRAHADAAERARVNATRALRATVNRVEAVAPLAGAHLRASVRTGRFLRYQPAPGGPVRWKV